MKRREFISRTALASSGLVLAPAIIASDKLRPQIPFGVQSGDITNGRAIVWSRCDRPARMIVEYATTESFKSAKKIIRPATDKEIDFVMHADLSGLPPGQKIFYRVSFQDARDSRNVSAPVLGSFNTAPNTERDVKFVWGGDVCGQGWGINPEFGGMKIFEVMRQMQPDFFIHSGDTIYADGIIQPEVTLEDSTIWKNIVTPEKAKVAESRNEFWGNYKYNLLDENLRHFNAEVPMMPQWDDHEVRNNWFPGQFFSDEKYSVNSVEHLSAWGKAAFMHYMPMRFDPHDPERIYRSMSYGPLAEVILLDERSYRGRNTPNNQPTQNDDTKFFGSAQMNWIKQRLANSKAVWKVIASDMPIGIVVKDGKTDFEAFANGNGPALGRELELAELLRFIKQRKIKNVVWITADVHYCAAHYYDPAQAQFTDFTPFWEFVAGPLNAGTFGPGEMDNTFGPEVKFVGIPKDMKANRSPKEGFQFFGAIKIDGKTKAMTVSLHNIESKKLYSVELPHN